MTSSRGSWGPSASPDGDAPAASAREVFRQVRRLELRTRGVVDSHFSGEYASVFKGQGLEFVEVREYAPGDDVRRIDWNVTARSGRPHVKRYIEERELTVFLVVDASASMRFGTRARFKAELAAEIAAVLGMSAVRNNDRVGLLAFSDDVEAFVPPAKGRKHALRVLRELLTLAPRSPATALPAALDHAAKVLSGRSIVFLVSDFTVPAGDRRELERKLRLAALRHDVVAVRVRDPREEALPATGVWRVVDAEGGGELLVDAGDPRVRAGYAELRREQEGWAAGVFRRLGIDVVEVQTDRPYAAELLAFFRRRETRLR